MVKNLPAKQEMQVQSLGQEDPLEEGMTTLQYSVAGRGYSPGVSKESDTTDYKHDTII